MNLRLSKDRFYTYDAIQDQLVAQQLNEDSLLEKSESNYKDELKVDGQDQIEKRLDSIIEKSKS